MPVPGGLAASSCAETRIAPTMALLGATNSEHPGNLRQGKLAAAYSYSKLDYFVSRPTGWLAEPVAATTARLPQAATALHTAPFADAIDSQFRLTGAGRCPREIDGPGGIRHAPGQIVVAVRA